MEPKPADSDTDEVRRLELVTRGRESLEILGLGELLGQPIPHEKDGRQLVAEEFALIYDDNLYRERIEPLLDELRDNPDNEVLKSAFRKIVLSQVDRPQERT